jgi:hypothetical protein
MALRYSPFHCAQEAVSKQLLPSSTIRRDVKGEMLWLGAQYSTVQYSTTQCIAVQCNTVRCSAVHYTTRQYSTAPEVRVVPHTVSRTEGCQRGGVKMQIFPSCRPWIRFLPVPVPVPVPISISVSPPSLISLPPPSPSSSFPAVQLPPALSPSASTSESFSSLLRTVSAIAGGGRD